MNTFTERLHEKIAVLVPEYHILSRTRKHQNHRKSRCISGYAGFCGLGGGRRDLHPQQAQQEGAGGCMNTIVWKDCRFLHFYEARMV